MRRLFSKLAAWIIYKTFIYFSRHVSYPDFRIIWEQAYQASVEAEWQRMRMLNSGMTMPSPLSSTNTKSMLAGQVVGAAPMQNAPQSEPTLPKLASTAGQEESQPPSPDYQLKDSHRSKYKKKGA